MKREAGASPKVQTCPSPERLVPLRRGGLLGEQRSPDISELLLSIGRKTAATAASNQHRRGSWDPTCRERRWSTARSGRDEQGTVIAPRSSASAICKRCPESWGSRRKARALQSLRIGVAMPPVPRPPYTGCFASSGVGRPRSAKGRAFDLYPEQSLKLHRAQGLGMAEALQA